MPPVFAHGRLRLYLLKLLEEAPRHGYEVIRQLEERFQGRYAPSAGTVYPRLAKLEAEGLVTHASEGGRKVYSITDEGRAELADRQSELTELELAIHESLTALAADIREDVQGSARDLRREMREAARHSRTTGGRRAGRAGERRDAGGTGPTAAGAPGSDAPGSDTSDESAHQGDGTWQAVREELRRARDSWREEARRAQKESRQAKQEAQQARQEAEQVQQEAQAEFQRIARQVQEQVQERARTGDWQGAMRAGISELGRELGTLGRVTGHSSPWPPYFWGSSGDAPSREQPTDPADGAETAGDTGDAGNVEDIGDTGDGQTADDCSPDLPDWAREPAEPASDPTRELARLLDGFRDDVRDIARDHGVSQEQLRESRRLLSAAAAQLAALLHAPDEPRRRRS